MFAPDTMLQEATQLTAGVAAFGAGFDVDSIPGPEVKRVHQQLVRAKKFLEGSLVLLARRVDDSGAWMGGGARSAEEYLAQTAGTSTATAEEQLRTSRQLGDLPGTEQAVKNGDLSAEQAAVITDAASVNPDAEGLLLDSAKVEPLGRLRERSRQAKADADADREATQARIHAGRRCRRWTDGEGAYNLSLRTTATAGAEIDAALAPVIDAIFKAWLCPHHHTLEGPVGNRRWYDAHGTLLAGNPPDPPPG